MKCQFENARAEGYCQKIAHADKCEPVTEMALIQRQCYDSIKKLSIKHPSMTAKEIKKQTLLEETDSLLRVVNQNRRPSDPLVTLPDNAESLLGNNQKGISRNIYNIKDGLKNYKFFGSDINWHWIIATFHGLQKGFLKELILRLGLICKNIETPALFHRHVKFLPHQKKLQIRPVSDKLNHSSLFLRKMIFDTTD